jgi:outer membrane protein assembly factor BamB
MKSVPKPLFVIALFAVLMLGLANPTACWAQSVTTYHGSLDRAGNFVVPQLSWQSARRVHLDPSFQPRFSGHLYAQPLYWQPPGAASAELIVATESNTVDAIDAATGRTEWARMLGPPVALSAQPCGNIDPLGITGTPVIDASSEILYLDAMVATTSGARHLVFALSLKDGAVVPGWPVDIMAALAARGRHFDAPDQNQRGALTILGGRVFVPYGGHYGDCGDYHGWVLGIAFAHPRDLVSWETSARGGGIWAPAGVASDGRSLYFATGNTFGARQWSDGEAVFKVPPDLAANDRPQDFFAPRDWRTLDANDDDLGGVSPMLLQLLTGSGVQRLILALGKDRRAYLLDADNLGGIGGALVSETVSTFPIRTADAAYPVGGDVFVAFQGPGADCPAPSPDNGLTVVRIRGGRPPALSTAWCGALDGRGSPVVTTTDGHSNPIVWILGAEGDNRLHAFRGDTGEVLFDGGGPGDAMSGLHHFQDLLPAGGRLYVGADDRLYAFSY